MDIHNIIIRNWHLPLWNLRGFYMTVNRLADRRVNLSAQNKVFISVLAKLAM